MVDFNKSPSEWRHMECPMGTSNIHSPTMYWTRGTRKGALVSSPILAKSLFESVLILRVSSINCFPIFVRISNFDQHCLFHILKLEWKVMTFSFYDFITFGKLLKIRWLSLSGLVFISSLTLCIMLRKLLLFL